MMYNIGITWGAFDLLHYGHLELLRRAKLQCSQLVVCVSTDDYVEKVKHLRPIVPWNERLAIVQACRFVGVVCPQGLNYPKLKAVRDYNPEVIFVGSDWKNVKWDGSNLGLPVVYIPRHEGISSTGLRQQLQQRFRALQGTQGEVCKSPA